jgi:hypothetical protein
MSGVDVAVPGAMGGLMLCWSAGERAYGGTFVFAGVGEGLVYVSGNNPDWFVSMLRPRNQPSPKSSSRSVSSMRSRTRRVSSSELRARNSSTEG